jgi:hypothetical protein
MSQKANTVGRSYRSARQGLTLPQGHPVRIRLRFPPILEPIKFQIKVTTSCFEVNRTYLCIAGYFNEGDINMTINGFSASIEDSNNS